MALSQDYKHDLKVKAAYYYYKKDMKLGFRTVPHR